MNNLKKIFQDIDTPEGEKLFGYALQEYNFYLCKNNQNQLVFLIRTSSKHSLPSPSLKNLEVNYLIDFTVDEKGRKKVSGKWIMLKCISENEYIQSLFEKHIPSIVNGFTLPCENDKFAEAFEAFITLFKNLERKSEKKIIGLWGELFIIYNSLNSDFLVKAWHNATDDTFDFSEDNCRLEVKTTTLRNRKHSFGLHQVFPKGSVNLIIASLMIERVPIGLSLGDLIDKIEKTLTDAEQKLKFDQLITETLGESYEKSLEEAYDETSAKELLEFFDIQNIPKIPKDIIPKEVSDVRFSVNLDDINTVSKKNFRGLSNLFDSVLS
tara:strand:+ start:4836 stop:5807 length:972 start_codon:yes stop_codon:yes gene_type:complete